MRPVALKWRIALLVTLVVTAVVVTISATAYLRIRNTYLGHLDRMLEIMGNGILARLGEPHSPKDLEAACRLITQSPWRGTGTHFRVWAEGAASDLAASVPAQGKKARFLWDLPDADRPGPGEATFFDLQDKEKHFRAVWRRLPADQAGVNVAIAHPSSYEHRRLDEVLATLLIAGIGLVLLTAVFGTWLVLLGIRPIQKTTERLSRITVQDLGQQHLSDLAVPRELEPFVIAVTQLLTRLDQAFEQQKQFAADASHELRTPLSLAQSTLQLAVSKDRGPAEYRTAINEAIEDLDRMEWLIDQLLTLARIDRTRGIPNPVEMRLDALLQELAVTHNARAAPQGGKVVAGDLAGCAVRGNEEMLTLLFNNLLDNAVKYGPPAGTVRVALEHGPGACCTASIQDDGGGIPPEAMPRLFDRFYRAESSRNRHTGGAGLGLAIAREVAIRHGGDIWVTSSPGTRTTFHVRLPCDVPPEDQSAQNEIPPAEDRRTE